MELLPPVRFPKIFSPRVLIRDNNRVCRNVEKVDRLALHVRCIEILRNEERAKIIFDPFCPTCNAERPGVSLENDREFILDWRTTPPHPTSPSGWCREGGEGFSYANWSYKTNDIFTPPQGEQTYSGLGQNVRGSTDHCGKVKSKVKFFRCPYCVISCSNRGQLLGHIRIHTGERPFVCHEPGCNKAFIRNEELTRHRRIHTGERPYTCDTCGKAFTRKDHLNKHVRIHNPEDCNQSV